MLNTIFVKDFNLIKCTRLCSPKRKVLIGIPIKIKPGEI